MLNLAPCTLPFEMVPSAAPPPFPNAPPPPERCFTPLPYHHPLHVKLLVCKPSVLVLQGSEQFVLSSSHCLALLALHPGSLCYHLFIIGISIGIKNVCCIICTQTVSRSKPRMATLPPLDPPGPLPKAGEGTPQSVPTLIALLLGTLDNAWQWNAWQQHK